jgi:chemotaxis protein CheY-P-specific phosphatase CheC
VGVGRDRGQTTTMSKQTTRAGGEAATSGRSVPIRKLTVMNRLGQLGVEGVASRLERLGGRRGDLPVRTEQVNIGHASDESLPVFETDDRVGIRVKVTSAPHGVVLVLFPLSSANNAATMMLSDAVSDLSRADNELAHSALEELGAMIANGVTDAWADSFDQRIDVGTPSRVQGTIRSCVGEAVRSEADLGLYIAARLHLPDQGVDADVFVLPDNETFLQLLSLLDVSQVM